MDQELLLKASMLEKQINELGGNLEIVNQQLSELIQFQESIKSFQESNSKEMFSTIGKGVHLKTLLVEKEFLVEVGAKVLVKKTPEETIKVIEEQINRLNELKYSLSSQLDNHMFALNDLIKKIEKSQNKG